MLLKKICINTWSKSVVNILGSIVVSIPACHAGDRGSIPRRGEWLPSFFFFLSFFFRFIWWKKHLSPAKLY